MLSFDGLKRTCIKFHGVRKGVVRCAKFRKGRGKPSCAKAGLVDGGRSPGLIRNRRCKSRRAGR